MRYQEIVQLMEIADTVKRKVADRFKQEQPTLTDAQINYYLDRWDRFAATFDPQLRDITRLSFAQVSRLVDDAQTRADIKGQNRIKNNEKPQDNLVNDDDLIYDRKGLTIILGDIKEKCIRYGNGYTWCISRQDASNLFYKYRFGAEHNQPVFYFVFDTDRPKTDPWHAVVIFVDAEGNFHVDTAANGGDRSMTWDQIASQQPKLARLKHLFQPQPLEDEEQAEYNKYGDSVDTETYAKWSLSEKYKYIQFGNALSDEQLAVTPPELIPVYAKLHPMDISPELEKSLSQSDQRYIEKSRIRIVQDNPQFLVRSMGLGGFKPSEAVQIAAVTTDRDMITELVKFGMQTTDAVWIAEVTAHKHGLKTLLDAGVVPSTTVQMAAIRSRYPWNAIRVLSDAGIRITRDMEKAAEEQTRQIQNTTVKK